MLHDCQPIASDYRPYNPPKFFDKAEVERMAQERRKAARGVQFAIGALGFFWSVILWAVL